MPFQDGMYYPLSSEAHSSAGIPSLLNSPSHVMTPSSGTNSGGANFKFHLRREVVDWRRINAVDVDQVASRLDVDTLQENVQMVTFCNVEGERCPRCHSPVDPALIKLLRLAQLMVEWLLHCQDLLSHNLRMAKERLMAAGRERDDLLERQQAQEERARTLVAELKQRKKVIRTQQSLLSPRIISHKCLHCEKTFLNSTFLQNHMQRRHPNEFDAQLWSDSKKSQIDMLKSEISLLKEQIVLQQQALEVKVAQEKEQQSLFKDMLRELDRFKAEEMARMDRKIEDSRDGIRREMESLYIRNIQEVNQPRPETKTVSSERDVDSYRDEQIYKLQQLMKKQDRKWESRLQEMNSQHEAEKRELQSELSLMRHSVLEQQESSQQLQQEMSRRLQEKELTIQTMREQVSSSFLYSGNVEGSWEGAGANPSYHRETEEHTMDSSPVCLRAIRSVSTNTRVQEFPVVVSTPPAEPRQKRMVLDSSIMSERMPEPAPQKKQKASTSVQKPKISTQKPSTSGYKPNISMQKPSMSVQKPNISPIPNMKKFLRLELEQTVAKKLETLGIRPSQSGLKNQELNAVLTKVQSQRQNAAKTLTDYWRRRDQICVAMETKLKGQRRASDPTPHDEQARAKRQSKMLQIRPRSSSLPPRTSQQTFNTVMKRSKTPQPAPRIKTAIRSSTPKSKTTPNNSSPPFSSDLESDDEPPRPKTQKTQSTVILSRQAAVTKQTRQHNYDSDDDDNWSDVPGIPGNDFQVQELARVVVKRSAEQALKKPAGAVYIKPVKKGEVQDLTCTDLDSSDLMEDIPVWPRTSLEYPSTSTWGTSTGKNPESSHFQPEAGTRSTLKSTLCSVSEVSDVSDISD